MAKKTTKVEEIVSLEEVKQEEKPTEVKPTEKPAEVKQEPAQFGHTTRAFRS